MSSIHNIPSSNIPQNELPEGGATDQMLCKASSTDYDTEWQDQPSGGGGSSKEYGSFYLTTGGNTGLSSTAVTLTINNTGVTSSANLSLSNSEVTVSATGDFLITGDVYLNNSSTSRTEYSMYLEVDTGGGYSEVVGSRFASYQRGYDSGMSSGFNLIQSVTSGDKFRMRCIRTDGAATAGYQDNNGTRITFLEV